MRIITDDIISQSEMSTMVNDYKKLIMCNNSLHNLLDYQQTNDTLNSIRCIINNSISNHNEARVYNLKISLIVMSEIIEYCLKEGLITEDYIRGVVETKIDQDLI